MADPTKLSSEPSKSAALPAHTVERWKQIVTKASRSGTDIAQLVQHFAEQSFQNKLTLLQTQGLRRRALSNLLAGIERERARTQAPAAQAVKDARSDRLLRPYPAVRIDFVPPDPTRQKEEAKPSVRQTPMALAGEGHSFKTVLQPPLSTLAELRRYADALRAQAEQVQKEIGQLDGVLNRGMRNHQAVVEELSATSRELYRIAQETLAALPPAEASVAAAKPAPGKKGDG